MILRSYIILAALIFIQGTFKIQYKGFTYGMLGDVVLLDDAGKPPHQPKIPAWITWTESTDSTWAQAEVIYGSRCDTMEFTRFSRSLGWFLKSFSGSSDRHLYNGIAQQNNDSIHIGIGSFAGISFYGKRDSFVVKYPLGQ